jgi:hypothetical protein
MLCPLFCCVLNALCSVFVTRTLQCFCCVLVNASACGSPSSSRHFHLFPSSVFDLLLVQEFQQHHSGRFLAPVECGVSYTRRELFVYVCTCVYCRYMCVYVCGYESVLVSVHRCVYVRVCYYVCTRVYMCVYVQVCAWCQCPRRSFVCSGWLVVFSCVVATFVD